MRPIVSEQDPLRHPLNELLGTQASVRLLRVMTNEVDGPLTASDVAMRAGLTLPGAQKALARLFRAGFISRVGGGRTHQYEIRCSERLMQVTIELFRTERDRYAELLAAVKNKINNLSPPPHAAWINTLPKEIGEPLTLGLLHGTRHLTNGLRQLRSELNQVEKDFDLTIELEGYTKADISHLAFDGVTALYGVLPSSIVSAPQPAKKPLTHREKDRQLQALSRNLAKAIEKDASLIRRAKEHIEHLLQKDQGAAARDLSEWRDILDMYPIQRLSRFLTASSARANRLRQSNPFFAILNHEERARLADDLGGNK
jgi:predicted transcriptional regulator